MSETINRRHFLRLGGMTLAVAAANPLYAHIRARGGRPSPRESQLGGQKTFVLVFQRGACDNLNTCIPIESGEHATYLSYRPATGIGLDQAELAPFALDSDFALHPELAEIYALYQQGRVAVLPNVHYDNGSRSHFDSQAFYESGTPWNKLTTQGWLSRHMESQPGNSSVFRAVSFTNSVPAGFRGQPTALSFSSLASLSVSGNTTRDNQYLDAQEQVYALDPPARTYDPDVQQSGRDLVGAIRAIRATSLPTTDPAAVYPANSSFGRNLRELAQLLKSGAFDIELAEVDQNGYDTHSGQGRLTPDQGAHPRLLDELSQSVGAFYTDLGSLGSEVLTLVVTEFGRTARANGSGGTDHGSAMVSLAIGGNVIQGVHFGPAGWYSLTDLRDGRDTKHSLDFRDVYSEILTRHLGNASVASVFPGWTYNQVNFLG